MAKKAVNYNDTPKTLDDHPFYGLKLDDEQKVFRDAIWSDKKLVVLCDAKAGTGKTTIALATANLLVKYGKYNQIIYIVAPYAEGKQGYLPGSISEKSIYYQQPFFQALEKIGINPMTSVNTDSMINQKDGTGYITCMTNTFLRGINLSNSVILGDEMQNYTIEEIKTLLSRVCDTSKVILTGHHSQVDLRDKSSSGFTRCIEHFSSREWAQVCSLTKNYRGLISSWADEL